MMTKVVICFTNDQKKQICLCIKDEVMWWVEIITGTNKKRLSLPSSKYALKEHFSIVKKYMGGNI